MIDKLKSAKRMLWDGLVSLTIFSLVVAMLLGSWVVVQWCIDEIDWSSGRAEPIYCCDCGSKVTEDAE